MVIKENFYDINGENLHITSDCPAADKSIVMPDNYVEIIKIASSLSEDFPFVRVDIYSCSGKICFGELIFMYGVNMKILIQIDLIVFLEKILK